MDHGARAMITALEIYVTIGGVIWAALDALGIITESQAQRIAAGKPTTIAGIALFTAGVIVGWPLLVLIWFAGMARGVQR
jgi:hypothetical protein